MKILAALATIALAGLIGLGWWKGSQPTPDVLLIVPDGYRGEFKVLFDEPKGEKPVWRGSVLVLRIPPSGTLRVNLDDERVPNSLSPGGETYSGKRLAETFFDGVGGFGSGYPKDAVVAEFRTVVDNREFYGFVGTEADFVRHGYANQPEYDEAHHR